MITKTLNKLVLAVAIIAMALPVFAESESSKNSNPPANGSAVLLLQSKHTNIMRMPSRNFIEVVYSDAILTLTSNYYEGEFSLSFEKYDTGVICEVPSIHVGESVPFELEYGEYQLTAVAEDGTVLTGYMQVY